MENDNAGLVLPPPLYPAIAWLLALLLQWLLPLQILPPFGLANWNFWVGLVLAGAGAAAVFRSIAAFRSAGTHVEPGRPTLTIVRTGLYRVSRNPIYLGCLAFHAGLALVTGQGWALLFVPVIFAAFHYLAVLPEEAYLARKFGDEYLRYKSGTRRWL